MQMQAYSSNRRSSQQSMQRQHGRSHDDLTIARAWTLVRRSRSDTDKYLPSEQYTIMPPEISPTIERVRDLACREVQIGRAHVCTPVPNAHLVCRLLLEKK